MEGITIKEYRAVFSSPYDPDAGSKGPGRFNIKEAAEDRPVRSEETHEYLSGIEMREITPWRAVPLKTIQDALD